MSRMSEAVAQARDENPWLDADMDDYDALADLMVELKRRRLDRRITQEDLAAQMGTAQSHLSDLESGEVDPRITTLMRWARRLDIRIPLTWECEDQLPDTSVLEIPAIAWVHYEPALPDFDWTGSLPSFTDQAPATCDA